MRQLFDRVGVGRSGATACEGFSGAPSKISLKTLFLLLVSLLVPLGCAAFRVEAMLIARKAKEAMSLNPTRVVAPTAPLKF